MTSERTRVSDLALAVGTAIKGLRADMLAQIASNRAALKTDILGGASAAYDSLIEIQQKLIDDDSGIAGILSALGLRVRVDAAQGLTEPQKSQARANIDAVSTVDLGPDTDYVAVLNAALL